MSEGEVGSFTDGKVGLAFAADLNRVSEVLFSSTTRFLPSGYLNVVGPLP